MSLADFIKKKRFAGDPAGDYFRRIDEFISFAIDKIFNDKIGALKDELVKIQKSIRGEIDEFSVRLGMKERKYFDNLEEARAKFQQKLDTFVAEIPLMKKAVADELRGELARLVFAEIQKNLPEEIRAEDLAPAVTSMVLAKLPEETADDIVQKVNEAKEKVALASVAGLPELIEEIKNTIRRSSRQIGGGGGGTVSYRTPTGAVDGDNTSFTVVSEPIHIVSDGIIYLEGFGYTRSGSTITMTIAPSQYIRYAV